MTTLSHEVIVDHVFFWIKWDSWRSCLSEHQESTLRKVKAASVDQPDLLAELGEVVFGAVAQGGEDEAGYDGHSEGGGEAYDELAREVYGDDPTREVGRLGGREEENSSDQPERAGSQGIAA